MLKKINNLKLLMSTFFLLLIFSAFLLTSVDFVKADPQPPKDPVLIFGTQFGPADLDPHYAWDRASIDVIDQVVESLFANNLSDPSCAIIPRLASDFGTWSLDGLNYTVSLRTGVTFHDGTLFNADAVQWNFERLAFFMNITGRLGPEARKTQIDSVFRWPDGTPVINKTEIVDTYTIKFVLNRPNSAFESLLSFSGSGLLSPASTSATNYIDTITGDLVGTGPFVYDYYNPNVGVKFHRFENYWNGPADIKDLTFLFINDANERSQALLSGIIDFLGSPLKSMLDTFIANPNVIVESGQTTTMFYLGMNNNQINRSMRQAISYAINYTHIIDEIYEDQLVRLRSPIPEGLLYANWSFDVATMNVTKAREKLVDAGVCNFDVDNDAEWVGAAVDNPIAIYNYTYNLGNVGRENIGILLQENLKQIGIKVTLEGMNWDEYLYRLFGINPYSHDMLQLFVIGWGIDYNDPSNFINPLFSNNSEYNTAQVNDPYLQDLMEQGLAETDPTVREAIYDDIQQYIVEELMPWAFLFVTYNYVAYRSNFTGYQWNPMGKLWFYGISQPSVSISTANGTNVEVNDPIHDVVLTFDNVTESGITTITYNETGPELESGFEVVGAYYDITTTATYSDKITVVFPYDETKIIGNEEDLLIMHWNSETGEWENVTIWVDTENNLIYGEVSNLSTFLVMEKIDWTPPTTELIIGTHYIDGQENIYITSATEFILTAIDDLSGIKQIYYCINGGSWTEYTEPFKLIGMDKPYSIEYYSVDIARNAELIKSETVNLVSFDVDSYLTDGDFNLITYFDVIFTKNNSGSYKLVATNPGQIFYNIEIVNNHPIEVESLTIYLNLPSDFVLKGANPIHIYLDGDDITELCMIDGTVITVENIPSGSLVHMIIHIDYDLKGSTFGSLDEFEIEGYIFKAFLSGSSGLPSIHGKGLNELINSSINLIAHQKKTTAIAGYVTDTSGNPITNTLVKLYNSNGVLIGTTTTDENGFYYFLDMPEGTYEVRMTYNGLIYVQVVTVSKNELTKVDFEDIS